MNFWVATKEEFAECDIFIDEYAVGFEIDVPKEDGTVEKQTVYQRHARLMTEDSSLKMNRLNHNNLMSSEELDYIKPVVNGDE